MSNSLPEITTSTSLNHTEMNRYLIGRLHRRPQQSNSGKYNVIAKIIVKIQVFKNKLTAALTFFRSSLSATGWMLFLTNSWWSLIHVSVCVRNHSGRSIRAVCRDPVKWNANRFFNGRRSIFTGKHGSWSVDIIIFQNLKQLQMSDITAMILICESVLQACSTLLIYPINKIESKYRISISINAYRTKHGT